MQKLGFVSVFLYFLCFMTNCLDIFSFDSQTSWVIHGIIQTGLKSYCLSPWTSVHVWGPTVIRPLIQQHFISYWLWEYFISAWKCLLQCVELQSCNLKKSSDSWLCSAETYMANIDSGGLVCIKHLSGRWPAVIPPAWTVHDAHRVHLQFNTRKWHLFTWLMYLYLMTPVLELK